MEFRRDERMWLAMHLATTETPEFKITISVGTPGPLIVDLHPKDGGDPERWVLTIEDAVYGALDARRDAAPAIA